MGNPYSWPVVGPFLYYVVQLIGYFTKMSNLNQGLVSFVLGLVLLVITGLLVLVLLKQRTVGSILVTGLIVLIVAFLCLGAWISLFSTLHLVSPGAPPAFPMPGSGTPQPGGTTEPVG